MGRSHRGVAKRHAGRHDALNERGECVVVRGEDECVVKRRVGGVEALFAPGVRGACGRFSHLVEAGRQAVDVVSTRTLRGESRDRDLDLDDPPALEELGDSLG